AEALDGRREQRRVVTRVATATDEEQGTQRCVRRQGGQELTLEEGAVGRFDPVAAAQQLADLAARPAAARGPGEIEPGGDAARQARPRARAQRRVAGARRASRPEHGVATIEWSRRHDANLSSEPRRDG